MKVRLLIGAAACLLAMQAAALDISNRYRSPRNPERKARAATTLIVLHTTEAAATGSLRKVSERGECHYCVDEDGTIYAIVDCDKEAFHAGRSMWAGKEDVDKFSVGIECVGYHDKPMPMVQLNAIAALVKDLKKKYRLSDQAVVAHSHVAYGAPNKWQKKNHRGRKRCGMLFATKTVRKILDLKAKPASDADVIARRLTVGDPYLEQVLYRNYDFMRKHYPAQITTAQPKDTKARPSLNTKDKSFVSRSTTKAPPQKTKTVTVKPKSPIITRQKTLVGKRQPSTVQPPTSIAELKSRGYIVKGVIRPGVTASQIAGSKWKSSDTFYTIRGKVFSGQTVDPKRFEKGMSVWMKK